MTDLLRSQTAQVTNLARSWEAEGATAFGVWINGVKWMSVPVAAEIQTPDIHAPITIGRRTLGELRVEAEWSPARQQRLEADASLIAGALRLEEELQSMTAELLECQDQLVAVFDLAQSVRRHLNIDEVLTAVVREVRDLVQGEIAFIALADEDLRRLVTSPPHPSSNQETIYWALLEHVQQIRRPMMFDESSDWPLPLCMPEVDAGGVVVPFSIDGRASAVLGIFNRLGATNNAGTVKLLRAIANQAGTLIESSIIHQQILDQARFEREMELAAEVQRTLLVRKQPTVSGVDLASAYHPAFEVCGDFFDLFVREDGRLVSTVADVTGKGLPAAFVMAMTRVRLRSSSAWLPTPAAALDRANTDLYDDLTDVGRFVTAFTGFYDPATRLITYSNCGHSPVIFCPRDGEARMLDADLPPLGTFDGAMAENQSLLIEPGDVLVIGTDGFPETRNADGEMFDYERLLQLVEDVRGECAATITEALFDAVIAFGGSQPQDDDRTVIVLKGTDR